MTTLADIVVANPAAARVFEVHAIDYCCHGQRPLEQACAEAGIDPAVVQGEIDRLAAGSPDIGPVKEGIGALIEHIVSTHHRYLRRELPRLHELMCKVVNAHGDRHPEVHQVARTLQEVTDDLLPHLLKEERVLFPLAIELLGAVEPTSFHCGSVLNPIRMMNAEHDEVGDLLATLRHQTSVYTVPDDGCPTWRALYAGLAELESDVHTHVHLENNVLFPRIVELESSLAQ